MPRFLKQLVLWTVICSISAAPSFIIALGQYDQPDQIMAMLLGVACFILGYSVVGNTPLARRWRRSPRFRRMLYIGYGTRIALSLLSGLTFSISPFPLFIDLYCGMLSIESVEQLSGHQHGAFGPMEVWLTTMIEGGMLNVILLVYMSIVYAILIPFVPRRIPSGLCQKCGYDLRASRAVCPECGAAIESVSIQVA